MCDKQHAQLGKKKDRNSIISISQLPHIECGVEMYEDLLVSCLLITLNRSECCKMQRYCLMYETLTLRYRIRSNELDSYLDYYLYLRAT